MTDRTQHRSWICKRCHLAQVPSRCTLMQSKKVTTLSPEQQRKQDNGCVCCHSKRVSRWLTEEMSYQDTSFLTWNETLWWMHCTIWNLFHDSVCGILICFHLIFSYTCKCWCCCTILINLCLYKSVNNCCCIACLSKTSLFWEWEPLSHWNYLYK